MATINKDWDRLYRSQKALNLKGDEKERKDLIDNYFFIYDYIENHILFLSNGFTILTGYDTSDFSIERFIDMIHPDDLGYFFKNEERDLNFTNKLLFSEHFRYILSYTYRIGKTDGDYITIQQQCQALEVNHYGHLQKVLVNHKRIPNYKTRPFNDYKIFDKEQSRFIDAENCFNLSNREIEIVLLVKEGLSSIEISDRLNISKHTIDTHRKNILNKTSSSNFMELIRKMTFFETF